jgi:hypothetical protein
MELRCNPMNMQLNQSVGRLKEFVYSTTWPVHELLHETFFITQANMLPGDKITLLRFERKDFNDPTNPLLEELTVRVVKSKQRETVTVAPIGQVVYFYEQKDEPGNFHVERGQSGKFKLMKGDDVVETFGSKQEAELALQKLAA